MGLAESLHTALARMLAAGRVEVRENGAWLALLENFQYDVRQQDQTALLHLWSQQRNQVRRVTRIVREDADRLALEVARLGRARPVRLEFLAARRRPAIGRIAREQFRADFQEILARQFPHEDIVSLTAASDLEHSLSGNYVRGILRAGSSACAVLGAAPGETSAIYDGLLTFGLIWLDRASHSPRAAPVSTLRLFFPEGAGRTTAHRLAALSPLAARVELYEYSGSGGRSRPIDPLDIGNVESWLTPRRETEALLDAAGDFADRIRRRAPDAIQAYVAPGGILELRYRGLPFARWRDGAIVFGAGDPQRPLLPARQPEFDKLLEELAQHRSPLNEKNNHALYRAQPERWLESMVAADPSRVDARLDPRFVYSQVPALSLGDRGVMDLVAVTRDGRLTVLELKAQEDIHMPLQAVDYWLRVRWHQERQEFSRYGYFPGITLDPRPPRLLLIAPSLRFHPATDTILRYLHPQIEIERIGVSEQWRRGIKVVLRQGSAANPVC